MTKRYLFNYTRATQFRDSFIKVVDTQDQSTTTYLEERFLGEGGFGTVRLFSNGEHQVAVKSPEPPELCDNDDVQDQINTIENEHDLMKLAYPDDAYSLTIHQELNSDDETQIDYRFIMPVAKGVTVSAFLKHIPNEGELAKFILRTSQEVLRINRLGIIHCDTNTGNIFVSVKNHDYYIQFIDFGISAKIGESDSRIFKLLHDSTAYKNVDIKPIPICREHQLEALASTFKWIVYISPALYRSDIQLEKRFPSIPRFIFAGIQSEFSKHQPLTNFITALSSELLDLDLSAPLKKICSALFNHRQKLLSKRLSNLSQDMEIDVFKLISKLIELHFYREMKMLMDAKEGLLNVSTHKLKNLLIQIVNDKHFPSALLREILTLHIPKRSLKKLIIKPIKEEKTILHLAFEQNQDKLFPVFFHQLSKLFHHKNLEEIGKILAQSKNMSPQDKIIVIDLVVHLLHLYVEKENRPNADTHLLFGSQTTMSHRNLERSILICENILDQMNSVSDPIQKLRLEFYLQDESEINFKYHGKKVHDEVLQGIYRRMILSGEKESKRHHRPRLICGF